MFEVGKEYKRKEDIHGLYGGQSQGGISTPKSHPAVFIFTSDAGEQHGYKDEYRDDGVFWYTGEGQLDDMKMTAGNKAILEHAKNQKTIYVFEYTKKAHVRYVGSAECLGYHEEVRPDREGKDRKTFIFHLDIDSIDGDEDTSNLPPVYLPGNPSSLKNQSLESLRKAALGRAPRNAAPRKKQEIAYYRSQALRLYVCARSSGVCEGCGEKAPFDTKRGPYLECHHVHRLSDGGPDNPRNVVALCPNCHKRAHFSEDARKYNDYLKAVAIKVEKMLFGD